MELPVNRPLVAVNNENQDGPMNFDPRSGEVNYEPSDPREQGALAQQPDFKASQYEVSGLTQQERIAKRDDFSQAGDQWRSYSEQDKADLIVDMAHDLNQVTNQDNKIKQVSYFYKADREYGTRLAQATHLDVNAVATMAAKDQSN
jgi:catalase